MSPRPASTNQDREAAARRRAVLRTAWIVAAIALLVYVVFLLSGVLHS